MMLQQLKGFELLVYCRCHLQYVPRKNIFFPLLNLLQLNSLIVGIFTHNIETTLEENRTNGAARWIFFPNKKAFIT